MPIARAGKRRNTGNILVSFNGHGSDIGFVLLRIRVITLFCMKIWKDCVTRVGKTLRRCTAFSSLGVGAPRSSLAPSMLAVATAS